MPSTATFANGFSVATSIFMFNFFIEKRVSVLFCRCSFLQNYYLFNFSNSCMHATKASTLALGQALYKEARNPPTERGPLMPTMPLSLANAMKASYLSFCASAITQQWFMLERSSLLATVPTNMLLRSISLYNKLDFSMFICSITFKPPNPFNHFRV